MRHRFRRANSARAGQNRRSASFVFRAELLEERRLLTSPLSATLQPPTPPTIYVGVPTDVVATYTDPAGSANIAYVYLRLNGTDGANDLTMYAQQTSEGIWDTNIGPWAAPYGEGVLDTSGSTEVSQTPTSVTMDWHFSINDMWLPTSSPNSMNFTFTYNAEDNSTPAETIWSTTDWPSESPAYTFEYPALSVSGSPRVVQYGMPLRLTTNVALADQSEVDFYYDPNNTGNIQDSVPLGSATTTVGGEWTWAGSTSTFAVGTDQFLARAVAPDGASETYSNVAVGSVTIVPSSQTPIRVVGYYPEYQYASFPLSDTTLGDITNLVYVELYANPDGTLPTWDQNGNIDYPSGDAQNVVANEQDMEAITAAAHASGCTVSIDIDPDTPFVEIAENQTYQSNFITRIKTFCNEYALDGVDLDWEPQTATIPPSGADVASFGNLITALRQAAPNLLISCPVDAEAGESGVVYSLPSSAVSSLDWVAVMGYDLTAGADQGSYAGAITGLQNWKNYGVPASQLVLGVPFYGRPDMVNGEPSNWSDTTGASYGLIVTNYMEQTKQTPDPNADSLYATITIDGQNYSANWYFNGPTTIQNKTEYVLDNGYGGMMIWDIGQDYLNTDDQYSTSSSPYSLLPIIHDAIAAGPTPLAARGFIP